MNKRTFVWRDGKMIERNDEGHPVTHQIMPDLPDYLSPLGTGLISGRAQRREEMKRHGVREVDPSEFKPQYHNERFAAKHGLPFTPKEDSDG